MRRVVYRKVYKCSPRYQLLVYIFSQLFHEDPTIDLLVISKKRDIPKCSKNFPEISIEGEI